MSAMMFRLQCGKAIHPVKGPFRVIAFHGAALPFLTLVASWGLILVVIVGVRL